MDEAGATACTTRTTSHPSSSVCVPFEWGTDGAARAVSPIYEMDEEDAVRFHNEPIPADQVSVPTSSAAATQQRDNDIEVIEDSDEDENRHMLAPERVVHTYYRGTRRRDSREYRTQWGGAWRSSAQRPSVIRHTRELPLPPEIDDDEMGQ